MDLKTIASIASPILVVIFASIHLGSLIASKPNSSDSIGTIPMNLPEQIASIQANAVQQTEIQKSTLAAIETQTAAIQQQTAAVAENTAAVKSLVDLWTKTDPAPATNPPADPNNPPVQ